MIIRHVPRASLHGCRRWFMMLALAGLTLFSARADDSALPPGRLLGTFEGIEVQYSPGQEQLARLLAHRFALRNGEASKARAQASVIAVTPEVVPLSPAEMRAHRAVYLSAICGQLALKKPTALQEECYDAFVDNYEQTMRLLELLYGKLEQSTEKFDRITIWRREELVQRLQAGESVPGFSYDPVTQKGNSEFRLPVVDGKDGRLQEIFARREKLRHDYHFTMSPAEGGGTNYEGGFSTAEKKQPKAKPAKPAVAPVTPDPRPIGMPVVIPAGMADLPPDELARKLWDESIAGLIAYLQQAGAKAPKIDPNIALLVLHETTEIGIVDRYYRGRDRRWFCDGVANYVPWRVARDLHGPLVARTVYNVEAQLARYADLREQADLRRWPAVEHQPEDDKATRLNRARYVFAAQAVFLMNQRAGEDILPRLFAEIGRTKPGKVSMKTVEKAWQKVTGTKLDAILAEAVQPPAAH